MPSKYIHQYSLSAAPEEARQIRLDIESSDVLIYVAIKDKSFIGMDGDVDGIGVASCPYKG